MLFITLLRMYSEGEAYSQTCFWTPVNYQSASYSTCWFGSSCGSPGVQGDPEDLSPQLNGPGLYTLTWSVCWVCEARVGLLRLISNVVLYNYFSLSNIERSHVANSCNYKRSRAQGLTHPLLFNVL